MPININAFFCDLNDFCRMYLVENIPISKHDLAAFTPRQKSVDASTFENLMLFEKTMIKVYGENIPAAYLINIMGEKAFEELVEQDAIGFVLWKPMITYMVDPIPGLDPLGSGNTSSPAHSDPEESLELGLRWLKAPMKRQQRRSLVRKLRDKYEITEDHLPLRAVELTTSAYNSSRLDAYGFDSKNVPYQNVPGTLYKGLARHAENILEYIYLLENGFSSVSKTEYHDFLLTSNNRLKTANVALTNFCHIVDVEGIPDLKTMYHNCEQPFDKLLKMRNKGYSRKFRSWLAGIDNDLDSQEVIKAYYEAVLKPQGLLQSGTGKMVKTLSMAGLGMGVGALVGGPAAAIAGAVGGKLIEGAADIGLDLLDEYVLNGVLKGWTPRVFIDKLEQATRSDLARSRVEPRI